MTSTRSSLHSLRIVARSLVVLAVPIATVPSLHARAEASTQSFSCRGMLTYLFLDTRPEPIQDIGAFFPREAKGRVAATSLPRSPEALPKFDLTPGRRMLSDSLCRGCELEVSARAEGRIAVRGFTRIPGTPLDTFEGPTVLFPASADARIVDSLPTADSMFAQQAGAGAVGITALEEGFAALKADHWPHAIAVRVPVRVDVVFPASDKGRGSLSCELAP